MALPFDLAWEPDAQRCDFQSSLAPSWWSEPWLLGSKPRCPPAGSGRSDSQNPARRETLGWFAAMILGESTRFGQCATVRMEVGSLDFADLTWRLALCHPILPANFSACSISF